METGTRTYVSIVANLCVAAFPQSQEKQVFGMSGTTSAHVHSDAEKKIDAQSGRGGEEAEILKDNAMKKANAYMRATNQVLCFL